MTTEWEGTAWAGATVAPPAAAKAETGAFVAHVQYGNYLDRPRSPQKMMALAQMAFHRNPWIGSAETTVTRRVAGLDWHLEDAADEDYEEPYPPEVKRAYDLLERPQKAVEPERRDPGLTTRRALISLTSRHIGLCGMAYWFLDATDNAGIPTSILYVNPARVWAATSTQGKVIGWVVDPADDYGHGGTPLRLDELLPFYLDPPDWGAYGTGLFERARAKAAITDLADQHSAYILATGGRLAGIVSPKEGTIPEEQYVALVREFRNVNEAPDAAKRTTILRGPVDFTSTAANPEELDLIELSKMNRDDIFAIWGVPPRMAGVPAAGGLNSGETAKQDEAILMQGAVHDRVVSISETVQFGLLDRWLEIGVTIDLEIDEPEFDDRTPMFELAKSAIDQPLRVAERRELIGLAPFGTNVIGSSGGPIDDEVWLPALSTLAYSTSVNIPSVVTSTATEAFAVKASKREFLGLRRSVDTRWMPAMRRAVSDVLATQRAAVVAKVRAASPDIIERHRTDLKYWLPTNAAEQLRKVMAPLAAALAEQVGARTASLMKPAKADPFSTIVDGLLKKVGLRIVGITATTQQSVADAIAQGYADGLSPSQIGDLIEGLPAFDEARAELVARTETMFAYNEAALGSYEGFGVTHVEAIDGDEDDECRDRVAGNPYTVEEAFAIEDHPNGTLDWSPILAKAEADMRPDLTPVIAALMEAVATNDAKAKAELASQSEENATFMGRLVTYMETMAARPVPPPPVVNVTTPETIVNVAAPEIVIPPTVVNVTTPTPVVNVAPAEVKVLMPPDQAKKVIYDRNGRITGIESVDG